MTYRLLVAPASFATLGYYPTLLTDARIARACQAIFARKGCAQSFNDDRDGARSSRYERDNGPLFREKVDSYDDAGSCEQGTGHLLDALGIEGLSAPFPRKDCRGKFEW